MGFIWLVYSKYANQNKQKTTTISMFSIKEQNNE